MSHLPDVDGEGVCGYADPDTKVILINTGNAACDTQGQDGLTLEQYFLHEVGHSLGALGDDNGQAQCNNFSNKYYEYPDTAITQLTIDGEWNPNVDPKYPPDSGLN